MSPPADDSATATVSPRLVRSWATAAAEGTAVSDAALKELAALWADLAQPNQGEATASGVLRACAMTLIVAAEDETDAQAASEVLAELMHEHPSRAIVLKPRDEGGLEARVFAQCWMPFGRRQQHFGRT